MANQNFDHRQLQFAENLGKNLEVWADLASQFIETQLSVGITFAEGSHYQRCRCQDKEAAEDAFRAKEALDHARKFMSDAGFTDQEKQIVKHKMHALQYLLETM